jgi:hypothetical protein
MPEITYTTAIPFCFHTILTLRQKLTRRYDGGLVSRPSWERSTNDTRDNILGMVRPKECRTFFIRLSVSLAQVGLCHI